MTREVDPKKQEAIAFVQKVAHHLESARREVRYEISLRPAVLRHRFQDLRGVIEGFVRAQKNKHIAYPQAR